MGSSVFDAQLMIKKLAQCKDATDRCLPNIAKANHARLVVEV